MNPKYIQAYLKVAHAFAECSTAVRLKVGAVLVKNHNILSIGINGTPSGWDNECETKEWWGLNSASSEEFPYVGVYIDTDGILVECCYRLKTKPEVLHAESNLLLKLASGSGGAAGATMFCTHAPCMDCAKLIYQSGVTELYFTKWYRDHSGIDFLNKAGIPTHHTEYL